MATTKKDEVDEQNIEQLSPGESYIKDGPTQDDLNPAYAPEKVDEAETKDAKDAKDDDDKSKSSSSSSSSSKK